MKNFCRLKNVILDRLCRTKMNSNERMIFDTIMRLSWGYNKSFSLISLSVFRKYTCLRKQHIARALKELKNKNIIIIEKPICSNKFNKNIEYKKKYIININLLDWK